MMTDNAHVLKDALTLYKKNFWRCCLLSTLAAACWFEPQIFLSAQHATLHLVSLTWILPAWLGALLFWTALTLFLYGRYHAFNYDLSNCLITALKRFIPLMSVFGLYIVAILCSTLLLIIPGLILSVTLLFSFILVITQKSAVFDALLDSHRLVWGHFFKTSMVISVPILLHGILAMSVFLMIHFGISSPSTRFWLSLAYQAALQILFTPYLLAVCIAELKRLEQHKIDKV